MKTRFLAALASLMLLAAAAPKANADDAEVRKALDKQHTAFVNAMKQKDISAIEAMATPDFSWTTKQGTQNRKQMMDMMKQHFKSNETIDKISYKLNKLTVKGTTAIVETSMSMSGTMKGPKGKLQKVSGTSLSRETWVKTAKGWQIKKGETISETYTVDGKKMQM